MYIKLPFIVVITFALLGGDTVHESWDAKKRMFEYT